MATQKNKSIPEDTPAVISYRVGQLELATTELRKTVESGQEKLEKKLSDLMLHFATKAELAEVRAQAHEEHERIWNEIKRVDSNVVSVQNTVDEISRTNVSFTLTQKIVFAAAGVILLAVLNAVIDKITH